MRFPIDTYSDNLMLPEKELQEKGISQEVIQRIIRLRDVYNYMLRNPLKKDREYIDYIQAQERYHDEKGKPLSLRKCYEDLEIIRAVIGNLQQCTKEWHRWRFNNMIAEGYAIALRQQDATAIAKLAQQYGKYNQLDKNDERDFGLSEMPHIIFCRDVSVHGFAPLSNADKMMDDLYKEFSKRYTHIMEDAEVIEEIKETPVKNDHAAAIPQ